MAKYGVKRPIQKGGHPTYIDTYNSLDNALDDLKYWREQEGESAVLVKESKAQEGTWWVELSGF